MLEDYALDSFQKEHSQMISEDRSNFETAKQVKFDEDLDVEGYDKSLGDGWGDFPLDAVFIRPKNRTVNETVKRIGEGRYILDQIFSEILCGRGNNNQN